MKFLIFCVLPVFYAELQFVSCATIIPPADMTSSSDLQTVDNTESTASSVPLLNALFTTDATSVTDTSTQTELDTTKDVTGKSTATSDVQTVDISQSTTPGVSHALFTNYDPTSTIDTSIQTEQLLSFTTSTTASTEFKSTDEVRDESTTLRTSDAAATESTTRVPLKVTTSPAADETTNDSTSTENPATTQLTDMTTTVSIPSETNFETSMNPSVSEIVSNFSTVLGDQTSTTDMSIIAETTTRMEDLTTGMEAETPTTSSTLRNTSSSEISAMTTEELPSSIPTESTGESSTIPSESTGKSSTIPADSTGESSTIQAVSTTESSTTPSSETTSKTSLKNTGTTPPVTAVNSWRRTVIMIERQTAPGQDVFLRGGIDEDHATGGCQHFDVSRNPCAIPIRHRALEIADPTPAQTAWARGDNYLDWDGAEPGQGTVSGQVAQGTPAQWTTNDRTGHYYHPLNIYGPHYWIVDVDMDCSRTSSGFFEFKAFLNGWESGSNFDARCSGDGAEGPPYHSANHFGRCGYINVYHWSSPACEIHAFPSDTNPIIG